MKIRELQALTTQWAMDRMIITNGKVSTQALKLVSEYSELCGNIADNEDVRDDIGDCLVVINNIAVMSGYSFDDLRQSLLISYTDDINRAMLFLGKHLGNACDLIIKEEDAKYELTMIVTYLNRIARLHGTTLAECWEIAYNDIKDRKGYLNEQGTFIKDELQ